MGLRVRVWVRVSVGVSEWRHVGMVTCWNGDMHLWCPIGPMAHNKRSNRKNNNFCCHGLVASDFKFYSCGPLPNLVEDSAIIVATLPVSDNNKLGSPV